MDIHKNWAFRVDLLDDIHELAQEPVADAEAVRHKVEALFEQSGSII